MPPPRGPLLIPRTYGGFWSPIPVCGCHTRGSARDTSWCPTVEPSPDTIHLEPAPGPTGKALGPPTVPAHPPQPPVTCKPGCLSPVLLTGYGLGFPGSLLGTRQFAGAAPRCPTNTSFTRLALKDASMQLTAAGGRGDGAEAWGRGAELPGPPRAPGSPYLQCLPTRPLPQPCLWGLMEASLPRHG